MSNKISYKVPATNQFYSGYSESNKSFIKSKINSIDLAFGSKIDAISKITGVNKTLIDSFIFIESSGNPNAISPAGAIGLMQLIPSSASDVLVLENIKGRLNSYEKSILTAFLGDRFTEGIMKMKYLGNKVKVGNKTSATWITREDLLKPELNILIGSILLGLLIDEESKDGNLRLDKVAVRYNRGYFSKPDGSTVDKLIASPIPTESKNYILKLTGKYGVLDSIV